MESLIINYPFIDSNKRTAFASFHCFLKINGMDINTSSDVLYDLIIKWITSDPHERYEMMVWDIKSIINLFRLPYRKTIHSQKAATCEVSRPFCFRRTP